MTMSVVKMPLTGGIVSERDILEIEDRIRDSIKGVKEAWIEVLPLFRRVLEEKLYLHHTVMSPDGEQIPRFSSFYGSPPDYYDGWLPTFLNEVGEAIGFTYASTSIRARLRLWKRLEANGVANALEETIMFSFREQQLMERVFEFDKDQQVVGLKVADADKKPALEIFQEVASREHGEHTFHFLQDLAGVNKQFILTEDDDGVTIVARDQDGHVRDMFWDAGLVDLPSDVAGWIRGRLGIRVNADD